MPEYHLLRKSTVRLMLSAVVCATAMLTAVSGFAGGNPKDNQGNGQGNGHSKGKGPKDKGGGGECVVTNVYNITNVSVYNVTNFGSVFNVTNSYNITNTSVYNVTNTYNVTNLAVYNTTNIYNITNSSGGSGGGTNGGLVGGVMWIDHFSLLPGDPSVQTSFNAVSSGVGGGLTGLVIQSTTTGETATGGGDKVVQTALQIPPGLIVTRVRVCYELTSANSFISNIQLAQVQNPPSQALVNLDDPTNLTTVGPVCVESASTALNPQDGAVLLKFQVNFGSTADKIVIRGVALIVAPDPGGLGGPGV